MFENKEVAEAPWFWATAYKGDCVYIPGGILLSVHVYATNVTATATVTAVTAVQCFQATFYK